jgi:C4-dicarboxylate-specific signal transduction histidine kinase
MQGDDATAAAAEESTTDSALETHLQALTTALLGIANATFDARAPRTHTGDALDVLAYLVNSTAEEVQELVETLKSERDRLTLTQRRLVESEKHAALGRLSAGIAHELNQPLTVITTLVTLMQARPDDSAERRAEHLELVASAAKHIAHIVDSVRTFGRPSPFERSEIAADEPLQRAHRLVGADLRAANIRLEQEVPGSLPSIVANGDRLQQVFVNLLCNARDALVGEQRSDAEIRVVVTATDEAILFCVEDDGPGVATEHRDHLFEPFFTTKSSRGTGLGLSVSRGIVREHGGDLVYEPRDPRGSRFIITIPRKVVA